MKNHSVFCFNNNSLMEAAMMRRNAFHLTLAGTLVTDCPGFASFSEIDDTLSVVYVDGHPEIYSHIEVPDNCDMPNLLRFELAQLEAARKDFFLEQLSDNSMVFHVTLEDGFLLIHLDVDHGWPGSTGMEAVLVNSIGQTEELDLSSLEALAIDGNVIFTPISVVELAEKRSAVQDTPEEEYPDEEPEDDSENQTRIAEPEDEEEPEDSEPQPVSENCWWADEPAEG